ncbi:MAG: helix-turn-helix domain-containing protein [SAR202 cluster bacterium]|nr:helix-turn-helix domain-containing protein [SAR202 cluster bacterium]MDP6663418.1 helix-turn-helix domain-containing protein [SAR202 cluster bacterium]
MATYRTGKFASLIGVHPCTIRRWMDRGLLDYVRLPGGERRIPESELNAIIQGGDSSSTTNAPDVPNQC